MQSRMEGTVEAFFNDVWQLQGDLHCQDWPGREATCKLVSVPAYILPLCTSLSQCSSQNRDSDTWLQNPRPKETSCARQSCEMMPFSRRGPVIRKAIVADCSLSAAESFKHIAGESNLEASVARNPPLGKENERQVWLLSCRHCAI